MGWKRIALRVVVAGAGSGALYVAVFVGMPWLTAPQGPEAPLAPQETAGAPGPEPETPASEGQERPGSGIARPMPDEEDTAERAADPPWPPEPPPLVAVRDNGETLTVVFPRETGAEEDGAGTAAGGLPPPLSLEEVATALPETVEASDVEREAPEGASPAEPVRAAAAVLDEAVEDRGGAAPVQAARPAGIPSTGVREVQGLLEALGYPPGPLDGIWGRRTEEAWRRFAQEAEGHADAAEPAPAPPEDVAAQSAPASPPPSGRTVDAEGGAGQAGPPHAGLPPQEDAPPVVVPGTLRGVVGYRMPLVSRQEVPDQVVSGVLIPAHTTFVILRPGYWELTGLSPDDVAFLRDAARAARDALAAEAGARPARRGWNPLRLFRRAAPGGKE